MSFGTIDNPLLPEDFIKLLGKRIRYFRTQRGMTQFDLAIASGMEENALQRIETGRTNPTVKTLYKIATALNIPFFELFHFPAD